MQHPHTPTHTLKESYRTVLGGKPPTIFSYFTAYYAWFMLSPMHMLSCEVNLNTHFKKVSGNLIYNTCIYVNLSGPWQTLQKKVWCASLAHAPASSHSIHQCLLPSANCNSTKNILHAYVCPVWQTNLICIQAKHCVCVASEPRPSPLLTGA